MTSRMAISRTTRTHLIYQFIILTLLFLAIGYNELLPDRKFVLFLAFVPMFCYQLLILSCCLELMPVPSWMNLGDNAGKRRSATKAEGSQPSSPESTSLSPESSPKTPNEKLALEFADVSEKIHHSRRWEKSVLNLGVSPKVAALPQKSKSWVNLSDSKDVLEKSLSREGSLDGLAPLSERKLRKSRMSNADRLHYKEERFSKAKSWKMNDTYFDTSESGVRAANQAGSPKERIKPPLQRVSAVQLEESELAKSYSFPFRKKRQEQKQDFRNIARAVKDHPLSPLQQEESELAKSYSFPFRQKRLENWLEMKETETRESNQSLDMPYWQTVGYNLAVKYEARRRNRAILSPTKSEVTSEISMHKSTKLHKSVEIQKESVPINKLSQRKNSKSTSNCINKIKITFSNIISKNQNKKEEALQNTNSNKALKPTLSFKSKNKILLQQSKKVADLPPMPQFLSSERPLLFYPKYIPFEKERFESDVQKKMVELGEEQKIELKS